MMTKHSKTLIAALLFAVLGGAIAVPTADAVPSVRASGTVWGQAPQTEEVIHPDSPLLAVIDFTHGENSVHARAIEGSVGARSVYANGAEPWHNSTSTARFVDHFHVTNPGMPLNSTGAFIHTFVLSGTMRIKAPETHNSAKVHVAAFGAGTNVWGDLDFAIQGSDAILYAEGMDNIFADTNGDRIVYQTVSDLVGGYYTVSFSRLVTFAFANYPINEDPQVDDFSNQIQFDLSTIAFHDAECDFSATFEYAPQNPIVPDPDAPGMPVGGWVFDTTSGDIDLLGPFTTPTGTGTGDAAFYADAGTISSVVGLDESWIPPGSEPSGVFPHGFFEIDVYEVGMGGSTTMTVTLPDPVPVGSHWWIYTGTPSWSWMEIGDDDGDNVVTVTFTDGGPEDGNGLDGTIEAVGGFSESVVPQPVLLSWFDAAVRGTGVDLVWEFGYGGVGTFALKARAGVDTWTVPFISEGDLLFTARDESDHLLQGGDVTYSLLLDGMILDTRTVRMALPMRPAQLTEVAPNPFNPVTKVSFAVFASRHVTIGIFDLSGRLVTTLVDQHYEPGNHSAIWTGRDAGGREMPSGTYMVRLITDQVVESRKISLVR